MNVADFWNAGYNQGASYRTLNDIELAFIRKQIPKKSMRHLDIGCGTGDLVEWFSNESCIASTGIDVSDVAIYKARKNNVDNHKINFEIINIETEPIKHLGTFDVITIKLVFAFLKSKRKVINKIKESLNTDGILIIINPVVTNPDEASDRTKAISVDDDITMGIESLGFKLKSEHRQVLSAGHDLVIYVFGLT